MQAIQLSDHFTRKRLLRFSLPSIVMMVFTSIYGVVDGYFVSNYTGKTPFAAVNLIMPFLMILGGVGFMFGTGGGALIAKTMGEGKAEKADKLFSMTVFASILCGLVLTAVGLLFLRPFARLMGAEGELLENSLLYGTINLIALPFYILQYEFQCLFATAEKPKLGPLRQAWPIWCWTGCWWQFFPSGWPERRRLRPPASSSAACSRLSISPGKIPAVCA